MSNKSTSKDGLEKGWTRATFIVREDLLDQFKDYAWTERMTHKEAMEKILTEFLADKDILKRRK